MKKTAAIPKWAGAIAAGLVLGAVPGAQGQPAPIAPRPAIRDIAGSEVEAPAIQRMVQQKLLTVNEAGEFLPVAPLTRGDFAVLAQGMFKLKANPKSRTYDDVPAGSALFGSVSALAPYMNFQPLCPGCALPRHFLANTPITRAQMALVMVRILGAQKKIAPLSAADIGALMAQNPDAASVSARAWPYLALAVKQQILPVQTGNLLAPHLAVTRAQGAVIADAVQQHFVPITVGVKP